MKRGAGLLLVAILVLVGWVVMARDDGTRLTIYSSFNPSSIQLSQLLIYADELVDTGAYDRVVVDNQPTCVRAKEKYLEETDPTILVVPAHRIAPGGLLYESCRMDLTEETLLGYFRSIYYYLCRRKDDPRTWEEIYQAGPTVGIVFLENLQPGVDSLMRDLGIPARMVYYDNTTDSLRGLLIGETDLLWEGSHRVIRAMDEGSIECAFTTMPKSSNATPVVSLDRYPPTQANPYNRIAFDDIMFGRNLDIKATRAAIDRINQRPRMVAHRALIGVITDNTGNLLERVRESIRAISLDN